MSPNSEPMKLYDIKKRFHDVLGTKYDENEIDSFFFILSEHYYKTSRIQLAVEPDYAVENTDDIFMALNDLQLEKPIQYIVGETEFYGLPFHVNNNVLIPRPETEELVDWVISEFGVRNSEFKILDVGTGSGCIAVSLAKHLPEAKVYGLDVSCEALKMAKHNAELNEVSVTFLNIDILNPNASFLDELEFDVIVSNPPYVREKEKPLMRANVLNNEPHLALFVKNEAPLQFYKAITSFSTKSLKNGGVLFFEINEYLGQEMIQLLNDNNFTEIKLRQDLQKKDRMLKGVLG